MEKFIGTDGLLYCGECNEAVEAYFPKPIMGMVKHPRMCRCQVERNRILEERNRQAGISSLRSRCFKNRTMYSWTFENDNGINSKMDYAKRYVEHRDELKTSGSGLLLWGDVGTGKSYMAACIANALIDRGASVRMTNFATIINDLFHAEDKNEYIRCLCNYGLLIIDDLGIERNSEYSLENVFNVIDQRYISGRPMIITTNMPLSDLKNDNGLSHRRIYDRILERCVPVCVSGQNIRRMKRQEVNVTVNKYLGEEASNG
jgi:DNA replication protein DnaC